MRRTGRDRQDRLNSVQKGRLGEPRAAGLFRQRGYCIIMCGVGASADDTNPIICHTGCVEFVEVKISSNITGLPSGCGDEPPQTVARRCCLSDGQPTFSLYAFPYRRSVVATGPTPTADEVSFGRPWGSSMVASGGRRRDRLRRIGRVYSTMRRRALMRPPDVGGESGSIELPREGREAVPRFGTGVGSQEKAQNAELRRKIRDAHYLERAIRFLAQVFVDDAAGVRRK